MAGRLGVSVGILQVGKNSLTLPAEFGLTRAAEITVENEQVVIRQSSLVCIFCGAVAVYALKGLGICLTCYEEARKLKKRRRRQ